jgi:hypothetical protein
MVMGTSASSWADFESGLPQSVVVGRGACSALIRQALCALGAPNDQPASRLPIHLMMVDELGDLWPLDEPEVMAALSVWLRPPGRHLYLVAADFERLARRCPRFALWRKNWVHRISCMKPAEGPLPGALHGWWSDTLALQRLDAPDWRIRTITNLVQIRSMHSQCADFLQRCEPSWPPTTLGL